MYDEAIAFEKGRGSRCDYTCLGLGILGQDSVGMGLYCVGMGDDRVGVVDQGIGVCRVRGVIDGGYHVIERESVR